MSKYIRQSDKCSCGPISVMNALNWKGTTYREDLNWFRKLCKCKSYGTPVDDLDKAIKFFNLSKKYTERPSLKLIDSQLDKGNACLLIYYFKSRKNKEVGHAALCIGRTPQHYKVINCTNTPYAVQHISKYSMRYYMRYIINDKEAKKKYKSRVYFIER